MVEKLTICLVGPKNGGKSSLLASLTDCVAQNAFGYSPQLRPSLQAISQSEFLSGAPPQRRDGDLLDALVGDYERLRRDFAEGGVATDTLDTYEYYFRLALNGAAAPEPLARSALHLEIVDAGGEIAAPPDGARVAILDDVKDKFSAQLINAEAIVFVIPSVRLEDGAWVGALARLIDRLAQTKPKKLRRAVVAFSQYERLFVRLGPSAFSYACDPALALYVVRKMLRSAQWMNGLRALEGKPGEIEVRYTVTSAYGFCKKFQNPNIDPHQPGEQRFRRAGVEDVRGFNEFWRPFLTAEPILYAALGLESAFTFSHAQIDASGEEFA